MRVNFYKVVRTISWVVTQEINLFIHVIKSVNKSG